MVKIPLRDPYFILVDQQDFDFVSRHHWTIDERSYTNYAVTTINGKKVYMHRLLVDANEDVDHINGNGLDNRRKNLRAVSRQQNSWNRKVSKKLYHKSQYIGVTWSNHANKWRAYIKLDKQKHLGYFDDEKYAAIAYNNAAIRYRGNFAVLNKV